MFLITNWNRRAFFRPALVATAWLNFTFGWIGLAGELPPGAASLGEFVFTSDVHFGINRGNFRGAVNVESRVVNAALVQTLNRLPAAVLPDDSGLNAGKAVGAVDFVVVTGDITNRQELYPLRIQSASASWSQFETTFIKGLTLQDRSGHPAPLLLVPGNHDVSNAIGSPSKLVPATDATSMAEMYNRMMQPAKPRTKRTYNYGTDKIYYAKNFAGVHCIFLTIWPDSVARAWMETDLKSVAATMPVFLFMHDPPEIDARHLTNPNGNHDINSTDKFENMVADRYADGTSSDGKTKIEQRALVAFLKAHKNIVAYFHGHNNWSESYIWNGPDDDIALNVFRADSPMKGKFSSKDESKLSFQVVVFDAAAKKMTVRECLWNSPERNSRTLGSVTWGESTTVSIAPRP